MANSKAVALAVGFIVLNLAGHCFGALQFGFYNGKCNNSIVEDIVRKTVYSKFLRDRSLTAALIRMQFHDCFVNVSFYHFHACNTTLAQINWLNKQTFVSIFVRFSLLKA